jgi:hypoxanthine phosphoribosyltransferase
MKVYYSYNQIKSFQLEIVRQLAKDSYRPDLIVGLSRGGLITAVELSYYLEVPMMPLKVQLRDGDPRSNQQLDSVVKGARRLLIVDDINDTGATLEAVIDSYSPHADTEIKTAVLIDNSSSRFSVNYAGYTINKLDNPEWCVFPWENWWHTADK